MAHGSCLIVWQLMSCLQLCLTPCLSLYLFVCLSGFLCGKQKLQLNHKIHLNLILIVRLLLLHVTHFKCDNKTLP